MPGVARLPPGTVGGVSQRTIYILLGSAGALVLLLVIIISANRGKSTSGSPASGVVKAAADKGKKGQSSLPPSIEIERTKSSAAGQPANSGRFFSLPRLPRSNDLLAYYSMGGLLQARDGSKLRLGINSNLNLGAVENVAPNASREHPLVAPKDLARSPEVGKDWAGVKDVLTFVNGQELGAEYRITGEVFTLALLCKVPRDMAMTKIMDIEIDGGNHLTLHAVGSAFHLGGTLASERLILRGAEPGTMANIFIEINGRQSRVRLWHWRRGKTDPIGATILWEDLPSKIVMEGYRLGCWTNQPKKNKRVEFGALAIYRGTFPESQKRDISVKLFSGAFPKF